MCGDDGNQAGGGDVPGSVADALRTGDAFARYLNSPAAAGLDGAACGEVLIALGGIQAKLAAAYAASCDDSTRRTPRRRRVRSSSAWLAAKAQLTKRDARAAVRQMRQFGERPHLADALATGEITGSWAFTIADWTRSCPADMRDETDRILLEAAAAGASLDDLATIAACAIEKWRQQQPDADGPDPASDRYVQLGTTFGGAGVIRGDLTPECAAAVRAVLEALGKKAGPEDDRTEGKRFHDALQLACELLLRASWSPPGRRRHPGHRPHPAVPAAPDARRRRARGRLDPGPPRRGRLPGRHRRRGRRLRRPDRPGRHRHHGPRRHRQDDRPGPDRGRPRRQPGHRRAPAAPAAPAGSQPGQRPRPARCLPEAWQALRHAMARLALDLVSGPAGIAAILRRGLLDQPYNTPSLPLDIGFSDSIPPTSAAPSCCATANAPGPGAAAPPSTATCTTCATRKTAARPHSPTSSCSASTTTTPASTEEAGTSPSTPTAPPKPAAPTAGRSSQPRPTRPERRLSRIENGVPELPRMIPPFQGGNGTGTGESNHKSFGGMPFFLSFTGPATGRPATRRRGGRSRFPEGRAGGRGRASTGRASGGPWNGWKARVDLGAAEAESRDEVEGEQVAAVRPEGAPGPARGRERVDDPQVAGQTVAVHGVEQENVARAPQARVPVSSAASAAENSASPAAIG